MKRRKLRCVRAICIVVTVHVYSLNARAKCMYRFIYGIMHVGIDWWQYLCVFASDPDLDVS